MIYINEAHATDVWPIGLSAGVLNKKHKTSQVVQKIIKNL